MGVSKIYCNEIKNNFQKYFGNWEPTDIVRLGDFGTLENNMFVHKGNISAFGVVNLEVESQPAGNKSFSTKGSVSVDFRTKSQSSDQSANAGLEIKFSRANSLFINSIDCISERFSDKVMLGNLILDLYKIDKSWDKKWVIVTDIIISKNTTIAISEEANSSINLEVKNSDLQEVNLLDADLSLGVVNNNQVGYSAESQKDIIPFIGLCAIKDPWFNQAQFKSLTRKQYVPSFKKGGKFLGFTKQDEEEFGQLE